MSVPNTPAIDAAQALRRLLALIDDLHAPQDLTAERVAKFSGLALVQDPAKPGSFHGGSTLTPAWTYLYLGYLDNSNRLPVLDFMFKEAAASGAEASAKSDICALDMDQFHDDLRKMGFKQTGHSRGSTPQRQYQRGQLKLNIGYVGESRVRIEHLCVKNVSVYFLQVESRVGVER